MRVLPLALVVGLLLAGCMAPAAEEAAPAATESAVVIDAERPDTSYGEVVTGPAEGPDLDATTAEAPRLVEGEWWRIRFTGSLYEGQSEVVRVVADASDEGYVFGMPHEGWYKEAISFHAPAFGDVGLDLSYDTHNQVFEPVRFPLVAGATWETTFAMAPFVATVESADEHVAVIVLQPPPSEPDPLAPAYALVFGEMDFSMRLTYDARQHEVVKFESGIGTWEVVAHGYGFEGWVTVPRGMHTAIDYGTFGPATPGEPIVARDVEVAGGFNRLTMMHLVLGATPGAYRVRSVTPDGTEFLTEVSGATPGAIVRFYEATDPDGTWAQEDLVAGVGATYSMGIAYHQYDIRLPDGVRRSDHSHEVIR